MFRLLLPGYGFATLESLSAKIAFVHFGVCVEFSLRVGYGFYRALLKDVSIPTP